MELGRSAALVTWRTIARSTGPCQCWPGRGGERRELRGHQQSRPNSPALSLLRLPRSRHATAPKDQRNLPAFTSSSDFTAPAPAALPPPPPRYGSKRSAEFARVPPLV